MNELVLGGTINSALTHFAMFGLANIVESAGHRPVRFWWTDEVQPRPTFASELDWDGVAAAVKHHAETCAAPDSWMRQTAQELGVDGRPLFSPRAKAPALETWPEFERQRRQAWPTTRVDAEFVTALGEPAWWRLAEGNTADAGASRWEMKTRNKGQEIVADRLLLLANVVAGREVQQIADGLRGDTVVDEVGKNAADSRTPTGFTSPAMTDNALAWCALWGLTAVPPVRVIDAVSATPGLWPRRRTHPERAAVPVWTTPVSFQVVRSTFASMWFDQALGSSPEAEDARGQLVQRGVRALAVFPVLLGGSSSAPERMLLTGEIDVLT